MPSFCRLFAKSILCVGTDIGRLAPQFADASKVASAILNSGFEFDNGTLYYNRFKLVIKFNIIVHVRLKKPRNLNPTFKLPTNYVKYLYRSVVSYNTKQIPIYPVSTIEKAAKLPVYDSIDAEVLQSYMEYSLASLIYYCMKEGATSEQSSRMTAMDNSSKNAGKI